MACDFDTPLFHVVISIALTVCCARQIFEDVGELKKTVINYDKVTGRSMVRLSSLSICKMAGDRWPREHISAVEARCHGFARAATLGYSATDTSVS